MRYTRVTNFSIWIILIALLFAAQFDGLAQSSVNLIAHYVEVTLAADGVSYDVKVYFSLADYSGNLISNLQPEQISLLEDGQQVDVQSLGVMAEEPTNIVLVMDTSGSMDGTPIDDAKTAAIKFLAGLKPNDQVAVLTFDDTVKTRIEFTSDQAQIVEKIQQIAAKTNGGTCLYDAAYSAVNMFRGLPHGNRAVILFTDGRDENYKNGSVCSTKTVENVITIASRGELRTPIYTVGLKQEKDIDVVTLKSFSDETGGYYLHSLKPTQLASIFQIFSAQLRSEYILSYRSVSTPGDHNLILNMLSSDPTKTAPEASDNREFLLPPLPPHLSFLSPAEGERIGDRLKIAVSLTSQGQSLIERVAFEINGLEAGSDNITPYEFDLDARQYPAGATNISAVAYGANNTELARTSLNVILSAPEAVTQAIPTALILPSSAVAPPTLKPVVILGIGLGALGITAIVLLLLNLVRQQREAKDEDLDDHDVGAFTPPPRNAPVSARSDFDDGQLAERWESSSDAFGALTVEFSDDESMIGHHFEINSDRTTLGRSAENDINFPKDNPVSRKHAEITEKDGKLYLQQVSSMNASGVPTPPKYGTAINNIALESGPVMLKHGDEILLGRRVRLKFMAHEKIVSIENLTHDSMDSSEDMDRTQAQ